MFEDKQRSLAGSAAEADRLQEVIPVEKAETYGLRECGIDAADGREYHTTQWEEFG